MEGDMTDTIRLDEGLYLLMDAEVHTGVLVRNGHALLIDSSLAGTPEKIAVLGVSQVDGILVTQHRRPHVTSAAMWLRWGAHLYASPQEADLLEHAGDRWQDTLFRWLRFASLCPDLSLPPENLTVGRRVTPGFTLSWHGVRIKAIQAAGTSAGALAWQITIGKKRWLFCGAAALAGGQIRDLWSLQRGFGVIGDYHGFLGAAPELRATWKRLADAKAHALIPSYGPVEYEPAACLARLDEQMVRLQENVAHASALNFYFPGLYQTWTGGKPLFQPGLQLERPAAVEVPGGTSFLLKSEDGHGFLIDCGSPDVVRRLAERVRSGELKSLDGVWISHMHFDHTEAILQQIQLFPPDTCPIYASDLTADALRHPDHYFLPCQYPVPLPVQSQADGAILRWHEFTLTFLEFPGQTLHHGALLVEGQGLRMLFTGDSFSPAGLDDYCPQNRVLPGPGRGMRRCIEIIRRLKPDLLFNQHQELPFRFSEAQLDELEQVLSEREILIEQMTGRASGYGLDDSWLRAWPFELNVSAGDLVTAEIHVTGHDVTPQPITLCPVLPAGWQAAYGPAAKTARLPGLTSGSVRPADRSDLGPADRPDLRLRWGFQLPMDLVSGSHVHIPVRVHLGGIDLGTPVFFRFLVR
jgi:glyoxylase-like metal-dependent hydrolase (beta-lactamase superfamily II)